MRCFNHADREAVGSCKTCCKGLCGECAVDLGHGLACRNLHEARVEEINVMILRSARVSSVTPKNKYVAPIFYAFMGLLFSGYSLFSGEGVRGLLFPMGVGFLAFSAFCLRANLKAYGQIKGDA